MHEGVLTCKLDTAIQEAAKLMVSHDVSALVVVDEHNHMVGLVSRTDLVKLRLLNQDKERWRHLPISEIMVKEVIAVHQEDTLQQASEMMMNRHIHRVVVIEDEPGGKKPVGILSITDIARDMAL
jgi:CBS domain-containing protein